MKRLLYVVTFTLVAIYMASCYGIPEEDYTQISNMTVTAPSDVINTSLGDELVYKDLKIECSNPDLKFTYQWGYGEYNTNEGGNPISGKINIISDKPQIEYRFNRVGKFALRLKIDNGEKILFKYFTLNVNTGLDEGILILSNNEQQDGSLTFIKTRTESEIAEEAQEIYPNIMEVINPKYPLKSVAAMFFSPLYKEEFLSLLVTTNDEQGSLYKMNPRTFQLHAHFSLADYAPGLKCISFAGLVTTASLAHYTLMQGTDGRIYRYDLFSDGVGLRTDSQGLGVTNTYEGTYAGSATAKDTKHPFFYNNSTLYYSSTGTTPKFISTNADAKTSLENYNIVNLCYGRMTSSYNFIYVIARSKADPTKITIHKMAVSSSAIKPGNSGKPNSIIKEYDESAGGMYLDNKSIMITTKSSFYAYYNFNDKIYRWDYISELPNSTNNPQITLPAGEQIMAMDTSEDETQLYVVTYNPLRAGDKKGSLFIYNFSDHSLVKEYLGVCDRGVQIMYKPRT